MILTLQRFKNGKKNTDLIEFPVRGLDMKPYVMVQDNDLIYDLYGVVNHTGVLQGGHYTA